MSSNTNVSSPSPAGEGGGGVARILNILEETTVDGPGFRTSIYCAGCRHRCAGCHNPQSWDMDGGQPVSVEHLLEKVLSDPFADVTFTGGDPMFQAEAFARLARGIKEAGSKMKITQHGWHKVPRTKTIWCYTGFLFENLLQMPAQRELLRYIDVLVDGPFVQSLRDESLLFRGSSNQRLIDVPASLARGEVVFWERESSLL